MTRADVSLLAVRLLALYVIADGISMLGSLGALPRIGDDEYDVTRGIWIAYGLATILPVCMGVFALGFSRVIARRITPRGAGETNEPDAGIADIQSAAIGTFGLLLLAVTLPRMMATIVWYRSREADESILDESSLFDNEFFVAQLATAVMALLLCLGPGFWVRLLRRFRNLGWKEE